jgi:hypothetical protein
MIRARSVLSVDVKFEVTGDPSTETLPSDHHKYASHICCIQTYSAPALGFRRFLSCGQLVRLDWIDFSFSYVATPPSESVSKNL